ncbi:hypothetical protein Tco_0596732 [Tanacetum coccineum]
MLTNSALCLRAWYRTTINVPRFCCLCVRSTSEIVSGTQSSEHTCLQASAQSEASLPSICDNALAMEYVCTSPIRPSVGVDQHMVPPITNEIPTEAFHDTYVNTTEYQIAS